VFPCPTLEFAQAPGSLLGSGKCIVGQVQLLPVMGLEHQKPYRSRIDAVFPEIAWGRDVPEALRHLASTDIQELAVQPVPSEEVFSGVCATLRDLVLMMGEDEIDAAGVYIQHIGRPPLV